MAAANAVRSPTKTTCSTARVKGSVNDSAVRQSALHNRDDYSPKLAPLALVNGNRMGEFNPLDSATNWRQSSMLLKVDSVQVAMVRLCGPGGRQLLPDLVRPWPRFQTSFLPRNSYEIARCASGFCRAAMRWSYASRQLDQRWTSTSRCSESRHPRGR